MAIKFNHKREILALGNGFPKYYEAYTSIKIYWQIDFRHAYAAGKGKGEKLILPTKIFSNSKSVSVTFIENTEGTLTIEVNKNPVYTIKQWGRISQSLLEAFTLSIIKEEL